MSRALELYRQSRGRLHALMDRTMLVVLLVQWVLAIAVALELSPYTWAGKTRSVHLHVEVAIILGGALNVLPIVLIVLRPGWWLTRHVIAASEMLWSGLLIHLTGGRIETHFHIFGALAFLAFYRDWTLLVTATMTILLDHLLRGLLLPESIYGVANPEWWRFLEHSFWVLFEDAVLFFGCRRADSDLAVVAEREARLEEMNATLEARVAERTGELEQANGLLRGSLDELHAAQRELVDVSRRAGMADAATAVLHNVGNVLNSINVSANVACNAVRRSKSAGLGRVALLLAEHKAELGRFLTEDERGRRLPEYLTVLAETVDSERESIVAELNLLAKNLEHVKGIVSMQQAYAGGSGVCEELSPAQIVDDALALHALVHAADGIAIERALEPLPPSPIDRHKVLQILTNLLTNAAQAVQARGEGERRITVSCNQSVEDGTIRIAVADTGVGVRDEDRQRIFSLGFTTKKSGHGLGLHASACAALEMKGSLTLHSDGEGRGARFTLTLPAPRVTASAPARRSSAG